MYDYKKAENKRMEMLKHQPKTADIATLISEKVDCKMNITLLEITIRVHSPGRE